MNTKVSTSHRSFRALDKEMITALTTVNNAMSVRVAKTFGLKEVVELNTVADMVDSIAADITDKYSTEMENRTPQLSALMAVIIVAAQQMLAIQYLNAFNNAVKSATSELPNLKVTPQLKNLAHAQVMIGNLSMLRELPDILSGVVGDMIGDTLLEFSAQLEKSINASGR